MNYPIRKFLLILSFSTLVVFVLQGCVNYEEDFVLHEFFSAQSHEELWEMLNEVEPIDDFPEEAQKLAYYFFHEQGRPLEKYLEEFDFLISQIYANSSHQLEGRWEIARNGIENFFYMNDTIFFTLLQVTIMQEIGLHWFFSVLV